MNMKRFTIFIIVLFSVCWGCKSKSATPSNNASNNQDVYYEMLKNIAWGEGYSLPVIDGDGNVYVKFGSDLLKYSKQGRLQGSVRIFPAFSNNESDCPPIIGRDGTIYTAGSHLCTTQWCVKLDPERPSKCTHHMAADAQGNIYVPTMYGLNVYDKDGNLQWRYDEGDSPAIAKDGTIYVVITTNYLTALNPDGTLKWKLDLHWLVSPPSIGADGTVYIVGSRNVYAVSPDGRLIWTSENLPGYVEGPISEPVIDEEGNIYLVYDDIVSLDKNGKINWSINGPNWYMDGHYRKSYGNVYHSALIGNNGVMYVGGQGNVLAIRKDTGEVLAYFPIDAGGGLNMSDDGLLYVSTSHSERGNLYVIESKSSGMAASAWPREAREAGNSANAVFREFYNPLWDIDLDDAVTGIASDMEGGLYVATRNGKIRKVSPTGEIQQIWQTMGPLVLPPLVGRNSWMYTASGRQVSVFSLSGSGPAQQTWTFSSDITAFLALAFDETLYVGAGRTLVAVGPDGTEKWHVSAPAELQGNLVLDKWENVYASDAQGNIHSFSPSGSLRWTLAAGAPLSTLLAMGETGTLYFGAGGAVYALGPDGSVMWRHEALTMPTSVLVDNDGIVVSDADGGVYALSPESGEILWEHDAGVGVHGMTLYDERQPLYLTRDGRLELFVNKVIWSYATEETPLAGPVILRSGLAVFGTETGGLHAVYVYTDGPAKTPWPTNGGNAMNSGNYLELLPYTYKFRFRVQVCDEIASYPVSDGTRVYVPCKDGLYAYGRDGAPAWFVAMTDLKSAPAIGADGTLYIGDGAGWIRAVSPDGQIQWSSKHGIGIPASPAIDDDGNVYATVEYPLYGSIVALSPDGTLLWEDPYAGCGHVSYSSPAIANGRLYLATSEACMFGVNLDDTSPVQFSLNSDTWKMLSSFSVGERLYAGSQFARVLSTRLDLAQTAWIFDAVGVVRAAPVVDSDSTVYVGAESGMIYAIDSAGRQKWSFQTDGRMYQTATLGANDILYFPVETSVGQAKMRARPLFYTIWTNGVLRWKYKPLDTNEENCFTPLLMPDGMLYLACRDGSLHALPTDSLGLKASHWPTLGKNIRNTRNYHQVQ